MEKIIHSLISNWIKGVDTYTHNGSTWLIFTDSKKWVIELTESKTLWYNYNFFKQIFEFTSLDVVENQQYITKWVEDNIINKVKHTVTANNHIFDRVEDTIQNGIKETKYNQTFQELKFQDALQNGVKETKSDDFNVSQFLCEEVIDKGVKNTLSFEKVADYRIEDTIQNGVKETSHNATMFQSIYVEDAIQNGVKLTEKSLQIDGSCVIEDIIQNGVRDISPMTQYTDWQVEEIIREGVKEIHGTPEWTGTDQKISNVIDNGVKKTLKVENGTFTSIGFYGQCENVIENGVLKTKEMDEWVNSPNIVGDVIDNGIKEINHIKNNVRETKHFEEHLADTIDDVVINGIKETTALDPSFSVRYINGDFEMVPEVEEIIKGGIKVTKTPGKDGDILSTIEWMGENNSTSYTKMIDDVIDNGVKETKPIGKESPNYPRPVISHIIKNGVKETKHANKYNSIGPVIKEGKINDIIDNGVKVSGTFVGGNRQKENIESVIGYGTKNPTD